MRLKCLYENILKYVLTLETVYYLLPLTALVINILLLFSIITRKIKGYFNIVFGSMIFILLVWCTGNVIMFTTNSDKLAFFGNWLESIATISIPPLLVHMFALMTKRKFPSTQIHFILLYLPMLLFILAYTIPGYVPGYMVKTYWGYIGQGYQIRFYLLTLYVLIYTFWGLGLGTLHYLKVKEGFEKEKTLIIVVALLIPTLIGITTQVVLPLWDIETIPMTGSATTITAVLFWYAITRYNLLEIAPTKTVDMILNNIKDYLLVVDAESKILLYSKSLEQKVGGNADGLGVKIFTELFEPGESRSGLINIMKEKEGLIDYEINLVDSDGEKYPVEISLSPIKDDYSNHIGYIFVMKDLSKIKELVSELKGKTKELEQSKETLESKNKELEKLNKFMVDREHRMSELKKEIKELRGT